MALINALAGAQERIRGGIRQDRALSNRLADSRLQRQQVRQQNALAQAVGTDIDRGNLPGAQSRALKAGNLDLAGKVAGLMQSQSEAERKQFRDGLETAAILRETGVKGPEFERVMRNMGADDDDIAQLGRLPADALRGMAVGADEFLKTQEPESYTLSPGQSRFRGNKQIASVPAKAGDRERFVQLTPEQVEQAGLLPGTVAQMNLGTGKIRTLQKPSQSQGIRTPEGNINLRTQGQLRGMAAQMFGGRINPLTQQFEGLDDKTAQQANELTARATQLLQEGDETNLAAAVRTAFQNMKDQPKRDAQIVTSAVEGAFAGLPGQGPQAQPAPTGRPDTPSGPRSRPQPAPTATPAGTGEAIDIRTLGDTPQEVQASLEEGRIYRLRDGRVARWTGQGFEQVQ